MHLSTAADLSRPTTSVSKTAAPAAAIRRSERKAKVLVKTGTRVRGARSA